MDGSCFKCGGRRSVLFFSLALTVTCWSFIRAEFSTHSSKCHSQIHMMNRAPGRVGFDPSRRETGSFWGVILFGCGVENNIVAKRCWGLCLQPWRRSFYHITCCYEPLLYCMYYSAFPLGVGISSLCSINQHSIFSVIFISVNIGLCCFARLNFSVFGFCINTNNDV